MEKVFLTFHWNFLHLSVPIALLLSTAAKSQPRSPSLLPSTICTPTGMVPSHLLLCHINSLSSLSVSLKEQIHHYEERVCLADALPQRG